MATKKTAAKPKPEAKAAAPVRHRDWPCPPLANPHAWAAADEAGKRFILLAHFQRGREATRKLYPEFAEQFDKGAFA